jgi:hypothetical protein
MATPHFPQNPSRAQVTDSEPKPETVHSLGAEHPADGLIEYLQSASFNSLGIFDLKNSGQLADIRGQLMELLGQWLDALALRKFIAWQQSQPHKVGGNGMKLPQPEPIPEDFNQLDPFFRTRGQSVAIRRQQEPWQRHR